MMLKCAGLSSRALHIRRNVARKGISRNLTTEVKLSILYDTDDYLQSASRLLEMLNFKASTQNEERVYSFYSEDHTLSVALRKDPRTSFLKKTLSPLVTLGLQSDTPLVHLNSIDINQSVEVPDVKAEEDLSTSELLSLYVRRDTYKPFKMRYNNKSSTRNDVNDDSVEKKGIQRCKEIVLPIPANRLLYTDYRDVLTRASYSMHNKLPGIYCNHSDDTSNTSKSQSLIYRMFPASIPAMVLYVHDLNEMEDFLKGNGIQYGILGNQHYSSSSRKNGKNGVFNEREIQIVHPSLTSVIDIRLSNNQEIMPYYREGIQAVLEGTIAEVQNARVDSGSDDSDSIKDSRTLKGDCWGEVKALGKQRIGLTFNIDNNHDFNEAIGTKKAYSSYCIRE